MRRFALCTLVTIQSCTVFVTCLSLCSAQEKDKSSVQLDAEARAMEQGGKWQMAQLALLEPQEVNRIERALEHWADHEKRPGMSAGELALAAGQSAPRQKQEIIDYMVKHGKEKGDAITEFTKVIQRTRKKLAKSPESPLSWELATLADAYVCRAMAHKKKGEFDKAIADYADGLRVDPKDDPTRPWFYYGRADAYKQKGKLDKEEEDLDHAKFLLFGGDENKW